MTPSLRWKQRVTEEPLDESERESKTGLKLDIQKTKIMASGPITTREIDGKKMETVTDFLFLSSKFTVDGDCNQIKDTCSLERKLWQT